MANVAWPVPTYQNTLASADGQTFAKVYGDQRIPSLDSATWTAKKLWSAEIAAFEAALDAEVQRLRTLPKPEWYVQHFRAGASGAFVQRTKQLHILGRT
jgi:hypothetical protein